MTQTLDVGSVAPHADFPARAAVDLAASAAASAGPLAGPARPAGSKTLTVSPTPESATRLLVEPGRGAEGFVYKFVDRTTGEILSEFPREAAKSLAGSRDYQAGAVLDESA